MEASTNGAPAVAEPQPIQTSPEPATQPNPAPPEASEPEGNALDAVNRLSDRFDRFLEAQQPAEQEPALDLLSQLEAQAEPEPGGPAAAPTEPNAPVDDQLQSSEAQRQVEEVRNFIRAEAQQALAPFAEREHRRELATIEQEYPDITSPEVMGKLKPLMESLAEESGNESIIDHPAFVRMAYKAVKAELADAGAVPAEQVGAQGASLETNAGQSQVGNPSQDEEYINAVYGQQAPRSVIG